MTRKEFETAVKNLDWDEIHEAVVSYWPQYQRVDLWDDGQVVPMGCNEWQPGEGRLGSLYTREYSDDEYFEDFVTRNDDGELVDEDGKIWDEDDALKESIREGYWVELYDYWRDDLLAQFELAEEERQLETEQEEAEKEELAARVLEVELQEFREGLKRAEDINEVARLVENFIDDDSDRAGHLARVDWPELEDSPSGEYPAGAVFASGLEYILVDVIGDTVTVTVEDYDEDLD
jgi:hypothetical protein